VEVRWPPRSSAQRGEQSASRTVLRDFIRGWLDALETEVAILIGDEVAAKVALVHIGVLQSITRPRLSTGIAAIHFPLVSHCIACRGRRWGLDGVSPVNGSEPHIHLRPRNGRTINIQHTPRDQSRHSTAILIGPVEGEVGTSHDK
jgi:hypothetical protein